MNALEELLSRAREIESVGPWPFITRKTLQLTDGARFVLHSRHHRKGLIWIASAEERLSETRPWRCLWLPKDLNWWIGSVFALGSMLFAAASVLSLAPGLARALSLDATAVNAIYFAGSIPFTTAAYLQLFQAANAPGFSRSVGPTARRFVPFGWRPHEAGWLSCALQFIGTLLFNLNTFDATDLGLTRWQQDWTVWVPDFVGSVLFLASGYLAFIETCHTHWAWRPRSMSWWITFANLLGCVGFMVAAIFAMVPSQPWGLNAATVSTAATLAGAIGFLTGSLLMLPEAAWATANEITTPGPRPA